jgi:hypothetical protein
MIYKGPLKRRAGSQSDSGEPLVFLLDHALLMVRQKNKGDLQRVRITASGSRISQGSRTLCASGASSSRCSEEIFQSVNHANCAAPFREWFPVMVVWCFGLTRVGGGQKVAYGTFDGVYFHDLREPNREPVKVLALTDVAQVDVPDDYGLLIVLSGAIVYFLIYLPPASNCRLEGQ